MRQWRKINTQKGMTLVEILAALVIVGIVFIGFMTIFPQMSLFNNRTEHKQLLSSVSNERDVLFALKRQRASAELSETPIVGSLPLQKKVPVLPLQDAVLLQIEKAEVKSDSYALEVDFSYEDDAEGESVDEELTPPVSRLLVEVELNAVSYLQVQQFIDEMEQAERIFIVQNIEIEAPHEIRGQSQSAKPMRMIITFHAFYRPDLTDLRDEAPKIDAPLPADKVDPTPFNEGVETEAVT